MRRLAIIIVSIGLLGCDPPGVPAQRENPRVPPSSAEVRALAALRQAIGPETEIHLMLRNTPPEIVCGYAGKPPPRTPADRLLEVSFVYDGRRLTTSRDPDFGREHARVCPTLAVAP